MTWNPIKYFALKRDWRLVKIVEATYCWTDRDNRNDQVIYALKENGLGHRKCIHSGTGYCHGKYAIDRRTSHPMYVTIVMPWLEGQYNPDIPNYDTIKAKEFKDKLAGKIT